MSVCDERDRPGHEQGRRADDRAHVRAAGASSNSGCMRAIRYTPAVTIVAAWISALTGVGPSIASGSHVCKGICADFANAPTSSSTQPATRSPLLLACPKAPPAVA